MTPADQPAPDAGYAEARAALLADPSPTGPARRAALAALTDRHLARAFDTAVRETGVTGAALVAVGGHGRAELSPRSDLDLLLLHDGGADRKALTALAERLWYPLWDLGLDLDHAVRTPTEARKVAADDLKAHLGLLDARPVAGDHTAVTALRSRILTDWRNRAAARLPELRELCRERADRAGELRFLLEPDLKEARGGLRDLTALRAVAASWLADAPRTGLERARRRLLDTRDALHLTTGRAGDRLTLQEQPEVARRLDLPDGDALLREVYEAAHVVSYAADLTWREVDRVLRARAARPRLRGLLGGRSAPAARSPLAEGVVVQDGEVGLALTARPERDPVLPLRLAAAAARAGLPVAPHAVRRLLEHGAPLPVPWPAEAREQLLTLLGAGPPTVPVWEALDAEGLITRLLPDWERVRCRPQRNPVHTWTVDRHLIETAVHAAARARRVHRPDLLLMAALLHDLGKGWPGDHSVAGETIARDLARRIGFDPADTETLAVLVRRHLLLVDTATRRDLDDPATIRLVADAVGDTGTLELLHALTEADAAATGPAARTAWRAGLVTDLVGRVAAHLGASTPGPPAPHPHTDPAETERLALEALRTGAPVLTLRTRAHPGTGPDADAGPLGDHDPEIGAELLVAVPDRPGVLPALAGVLALHRLTVHAADLREVTPPDTTGLTGEALVLRWRVAAEYGTLPEAARLRADLLRALDGTLDLGAKLAARRAAAPRRRGARPPEPTVTVLAEVSATATVLEVRAPDEVGLLHRIGAALEGAGARVRSAHVSTLGGNAVDSVYVTDPDGKPLTAEAARALAGRVAEALRAD
ncbi:[protein-PII] uridylyltransferase [Streptomyces sp. BI20]|uniref:[protein-PII] uridylyltransferase n=1 Tax=Streptomyces sp. BI20 TaxID=3403460 RepID=UPI003C74FD50